jgi:hypothetical protein
VARGWHRGVLLPAVADGVVGFHLAEDAVMPSLPITKTLPR